MRIFRKYNNNQISQCTMDYNIDGIYFQMSSEYNIIENCTARYNTEDGLNFIGNTNNNLIINSSFNYNLDNGIYLNQSLSNTVINCTCISNNNSGIRLSQVQNSILYDNQMYYNSIIIDGDDLVEWTTHTIPTNNTVSAGTDRAAQKATSIIHIKRIYYPP